MEEMPQHWNKPSCVLFIKKGDSLDCSNYRGISLIPNVYKVLSNILFSCLLLYSEREIGKCQSGFRKVRSTIDQIFILRTILEKGFEYKLPTHHLFVNFKAAHDSLYQAMKQLNIPVKLIHQVKMTMCDALSVSKETSQEFPTTKGARQGEALTCLLFYMALEKMVHDSGISAAGAVGICQRHRHCSQVCHSYETGLYGS